MSKDNKAGKMHDNGNLAVEIGTLLKNNIREYAMYIALVAIFVFFQFQTKGLFLSALNITNLINQAGYVSILAIGMTLILIIRHIDLSVGFVAGFTGAISALVLMKFTGLNAWLAILLSLVVGALIGLYQGTLIAYVKVPAFVTTLAGMFIFRGLLSLLTQETGSVIVNDETYKMISQGFIPDYLSSFTGGTKYHILTLAIGLAAVALMMFSQIRARRNKQKYDFKVTSAPIFIAVLLLSAAVIMSVIFLLASHNGLPWTAVVVGVVLMIYNFVLNKTKLGRYIYGIGGNPEAAELSGINVKKVTLLCFVSMSTLAALAGILYTSRIGSAATNAGVGFELDAIASSYIGGVAVSGGVGRVTNTIIGALVIMSLTSGFNLLGVDVSYQYIAKGVIFIIAVAFDVISRKKR